MTWQPKTLGQFLLEKDPSSEALVTQDRRFTYGELREKAQQAAGSMQALGVVRRALQNLSSKNFGPPLVD